MFKMALLKHFMPIALSVCMVVQSVPATALAAEQTETVVEETQTIETKTDDTDVEVSETMPSTKVTEAEPEQAEQTQEPKDPNEESATVSDNENTPKAEESVAQDGENSDSNLSNTETSEGNPSADEISEEQSTENEEDTIVEETVEETSSEVEASEVQNSENDLMEGESASATQDNMSISIDNIAREMYSLSFRVSLTGDAPEGSYFVLYYREKPANGAENTWESDYNGVSSDKTASFYIYSYNGADLKEGTTYEYVLGIGDAYNTPKEQLKASVTDKVATEKDTRTLSLVSADTGYTYATLSARLTGNTKYLETYLCSFYRKKTDGDTETWTACDGDWTYNSSYNYHVSVTDLDPGTTYEYVIVADNDYVSSSSLEDIPADRKVADTFVTKKAPTYTFTFEPVAEKCTSDTEVLTVKATGGEDDTKLDVTLLLDSGREVEVSLKQKADYTNQVVIEGLEEEREYTIVKADVWATETIPYYYDGEYDGSETYEVKIASIDQQFKFKTKAAAVATSIEIVGADKELKLTKLYDAYSYNKTLTNIMEVKVEPEDALSDIVWTSSDTSVARISYYGDNKVVVSVPTDLDDRRVGEATITAASRKDPTKKAERKVIVKDYEVILTNNGVDYPLYGDDGVSLTKMANEDPSQKITNVATNIGFYEVAEDGSKTPLTDFNVISDKPGVANWVKDELTGIASYAVGTTRMTFEKDGYKATINVSVNVESRGFDITGLTASNSRYPAIDRGDNTYEIAYVSGISYRANGMISPKETFSASGFTWSSSNEAVATVNNGVITPLQKGNTKITVKPKDEKKFTKIKERSFNLVVKEVPSSVGATPTVYALTNTTKTLNDVKFPESWGEGWAWKEPQTPLYNIPVNSSAYAFEASYTGEDYYAYEGSVNVYVGTITGVYASETLSGTSNYHNGVLLTGTDSLTLRVSPSSMGSLSSDLYTISAPTIKGNGLTVTPATDSEGNVINGQYKITASAAGKYTLNLEIKSGEQVIATGKYNLTVVADEQIGSITINSADANTVPITNNMISFDFGKETKEFNLTAEAHNRDTNQTLNTTTKLNWTITDKSVADVKVDKTDTRKATVTVKGEGHAVIQVTAADAVGKYAQVNLEIRNHAPRVEGSKTTVNTAFDYETNDGRQLSYSLYGKFEIVPVYDETVSSSNVTVQENGTVSANFSAYQYSGRYYIIVPKQNKEVPNGTYKCDLAVKTIANDEPYKYPITISVINKQPKVTAKITQGMNLFYIPEQGEAEIKLENTTYGIEALNWKDSSSGSKGFTFGDNYYTKVSYTKGKKPSNFKYYRISQKNVQVNKDGKLKDDTVAQGTLTVKLKGVKDSYTFDNIKIKYNYKKPKLKTIDAITGKNTSSIIPSMGSTDAEFYLYDSLKKCYLYYDSYDNYANDYDSYRYYNEVICANDSVEYFDVYSDSIYFTYIGTKTKDTIPLTVDSSAWRERLTVNHVVKVVKPKAALSNAKLTYNTNYMNEAYTYILLKDYGTVRFTDVAIAGANAKSQQLLDNDRLQLIHSYGDYSYNDSSYRVYARLNKLKLTDDTVPSGSYAYNLTPYYTDQSTGEKKALNTLKLTITFTDKPITAKISAKGTLDLAQRSSTYIRLTPKFSNIGSGYSVTGRKLVGEYSKYFTLNNTYYNGVYDLEADSYNLKAGHTYNLAVEYTVRASGGETFTVTSNRFKVKPKQTAPKVTVATKPQNLYAANANITRSYRISVPSTYSISYAGGSIDVNKDGKADISITSSPSGSSASLTVRIQDKDAVIAAANGKSYSIPVTVRVTGRDGISKDASTTIKVNIKR